MTYRNVDDAPDAALAILLKYGAYLVALREVACMAVDLGAVLVLRGRVRGECNARDLRDALEGLGRGVVVVVDGDDLVPARLLEGEDDVRGWGQERCAREHHARSAKESEGNAAISSETHGLAWREGVWTYRCSLHHR